MSHRLQNYTTGLLENEMTTIDGIDYGGNLMFRRPPMENIKPFIEKWSTTFSTKIRTEPTDVLHLPSFLLGCFVTVTIFSLIPVMKLFLGSLVLAVITLFKYSVIGGGIVAFLVAIKNKGGEKVRIDKSLRHDKSVLTSNKVMLTEAKHTPAPQAPTQAMVYPPHDGSGLVKDDFEGIRHYDIPIDRSEYQNRKLPVTNEQAYNSFINKAAVKYCDSFT